MSRLPNPRGVQPEGILAETQTDPLARASPCMSQRERRGSFPLWHHLGATTFGLKRARYGASRPARTQALKGAYEHQLSPLRPLRMSLAAVEQALVRLSMGWLPPMRVSSRPELRLCQHSPRPECRRTHLDATKKAASHWPPGSCSQSEAEAGLAPANLVMCALTGWPCQ